LANRKKTEKIYDEEISTNPSIEEVVTWILLLLVLVTPDYTVIRNIVHGHGLIVLLATFILRMLAWMCSAVVVCKSRKIPGFVRLFWFAYFAGLLYLTPSVVARWRHGFMWEDVAFIVCLCSQAGLALGLPLAERLRHPLLLWTKKAQTQRPQLSRFWFHYRRNLLPFGCAVVACLGSVSLLPSCAEFRENVIFDLSYRPAVF